MRHLLLISALCLSAAPAFALKDYNDMAACGSAKVVSGDTCSNVKVELNFDGCAIKAEPQVAQRIVCVGNVIKARYQNETYRYEAQFEKKADDWGGVKWTTLGPIAQWEKKSSSPQHMPAQALQTSTKVAAEATAAVVAPPHESPEVRAVAPVTEAAPVAAASPFKFGAFADLRYTNYTTRKSDADSRYAQAQSGWGVEDGALTASFEKDRLAVIADVAFRRQKDIDFSATGAGQQYSNNNNIVFGDNTSQIYFKYKLTDALILDFGQYDTIFGVELNDSKDRIFGKTGIIYDNMIPVTHTGMMLEYSQSGVYAKVMGANGNGRGTNGYSTATPSTQDEQAEVGGVVGYSNDWIHGQVGYLTRQLIATSGDLKSRSLIDAVIGAVCGRFAIDLEFASINDPSKNTLTASATDSETAGTGYMAIASYKVTDAFLVGARYERIENDPGAASYQTGSSYGGSLHYRLTDNLESRLDYVGYNYKPVTGASWDESRFNVGGVISF